MIRAATGLACLAIVIAVAARITGAAEEKNAPTGQVRIQQVEVKLSDVGPVVLLKAENRAIPVFVDPTVAESIHAALSGGKLRRPYTHNLMYSVLDGFGGKVAQVVISLKGSTYYAEMTVAMRETTKIFDSRASDAIALAIHFKAPILVSRELLMTAGKPVELPPGATSL